MYIPKGCGQRFSRPFSTKTYAGTFLQYRRKHQTLFHQMLTCAKSVIETLEIDMEYVQSNNKDTR